jgi:hypothetical protein
MTAQTVQIDHRASMVKRGRRLEYFTIIYNGLEGPVALVTGLMARSIAWVGFGFDSLTEVTSGGPGLAATQMIAARTYREDNFAALSVSA